MFAGLQQKWSYLFKLLKRNGRDIIAFIDFANSLTNQTLMLWSHLLETTIFVSSPTNVNLIARRSKLVRGKGVDRPPRFYFYNFQKQS